MPFDGAGPAPCLAGATLFGRLPTGWAAALSAGALVLAAGCAPTPTQTSPAAGAASAPATGATAAATRPPPPPSAATTARAYRKDAASHVYALNADRVYAGKLPPMLYAVGVLEVDVDRKGNVVGLHWLRAPRHAPEVVTEIERTARAAAPYPVPERLGKVTYTDTWLWDKSGRFQLDTLTEGQN